MEQFFQSIPIFHLNIQFFFNLYTPVFLLRMRNKIPNPLSFPQYFQLYTRLFIDAASVLHLLGIKTINKQSFSTLYLIGVTIHIAYACEIKAIDAQLSLSPITVYEVDKHQLQATRKEYYALQSFVAEHMRGQAPFNNIMGEMNGAINFSVLFCRSNNSCLSVIECQVFSLGI